jgi:integrase
MRCSDLLNVDPSFFTKTARGTNIVRYVPQKTKGQSQTPLSIPMNIWDECEIIAQRYDYKFPKVTEQKLRKYIKEIGKLAKITDEYYVASGSMQRKEAYPKYELITIHTARRTFCTLLYFGNYNLTTGEIMKMSGHTKESTFMKYIRATGDEVADKIGKKIMARKQGK